MSEDRIWQVRLSDGSAWTPPDSRPGDPRSSWIYARETAQMFADKLNGTVVEVTRRQHEGVLDREIAEALAEPTPLKKTGPKTRTRPFGRDARRAIATALLESVPLNYAARSAVDTVRETADDLEYKRALGIIRAGLPAAWWVGYDAKQRRGLAQEAEPLWITDDPHGEDPREWQLLDRDEIASILAEGA
jgi:hypothetical protein